MLPSDVMIAELKFTLEKWHKSKFAMSQNIKQGITAFFSMAKHTQTLSLKND